MSSIRTDLNKIFLTYCTFGDRNATTLEGAKFAKLCKETKLIDSKFTTVDVDLIFGQAKAKTDRKLTFEQFETSLGLIAKKKSVDVDVVKNQIIAAGGPANNGGTVADKVAFHDDKSLFTGTHKAGGPSTIDTDKVQMEKLLDRTPADIRGRHK